MVYISYNWWYALVGIIIYLIMLFIAKPYVTYINPPDNRKSKGYIFFFILFIINSIYGLWAADTYHVWESFKEAEHYARFELVSYEDVYNWLGFITNNNYFLWRTLIWFPACLFMYYTAKQLNLLHRNFLVALALFAGFAAYTRGMLGHTMMLYGVVLCVLYNKFYIRLIGLLLVILSYFFHKSMFINIIFAIIALYPFGKNTIKISILAFPFLTILASNFINSISSGIPLFSGNDMISNTALIYANENSTQSNTLGLIANIIQYVPEYLTLLYLYNRIFYKQYLSGVANEQTFKFLYRLTYTSIYIASLFLFVETSNWIYLRCKYMAFFPLVFILGKIWNLEPKSNKWIKSIIVLQLFAILYKYMYLLYKWIQL